MATQDSFPNDGPHEGGYGAPDPEAELPRKGEEGHPSVDFPSAEAELDEGNTDDAPDRASLPSEQDADTAGEDDSGTGSGDPDQAPQS